MANNRPNFDEQQQTPSPTGIDYDSYLQAIEARLDQNKIPTTITGPSGALEAFFDLNAMNGFEVTEEFLVDEDLSTFVDFLLNEFINVLQFARAGGLVPLAEGTLDTDVTTFDENGTEITFNNKQKFLNEAGSIIEDILEKEESDLTVDDYRTLVGKFVYYIQFLDFDKEVNGSTNPNAISTAGTTLTECALDLTNQIGNKFKIAFVDLSVYEYLENGTIVAGSEIKTRAMIPSKFIESLKMITDSCKGNFLGQDPTPTKTVTETKTPKQMEKLTALLDSTTREIIGTNITKDDVGLPNPEGGVYSLNQMRNEVIGTYEVEPTPYLVTGNQITYELSDPVAVEAQWEKLI